MYKVQSMARWAVVSIYRANFCRQPTDSAHMVCRAMQPHAAASHNQNPYSGKMHHNTFDVPVGFCRGRMLWVPVPSPSDAPGCVLRPVVPTVAGLSGGFNAGLDSRNLTAVDAGRLAAIATWCALFCARLRVGAKRWKQMQGGRFNDLVQPTITGCGFVRAVARTRYRSTPKPDELHNFS